jgi:hypothetical protein
MQTLIKLSNSLIVSLRLHFLLHSLYFNPTTPQLAAKELSPDNNDPIQPTVAANAFVQVIMMLRRTFIQGAVSMIELHPCHPVWQHSIFSDPAYLPSKR